MKNQLLYVHGCVCVCVCVCVYVCVLVLIGQIDLADWMPFRPFILWWRSARIQEHSLEIPNVIHHHGITEKTKMALV